MAIRQEKAEMPAELALGSARGGKKASKQLSWSIVRALTPEDLPKIQNPPPIGFQGQRLRELRSAHHQLAQLIASGEEHETICLMTGYSMARISILKGDPAFAELIKYYQIQREQVFIDLVEREKALGIATLEELQARLEEDPAGWTRKELMELYDRLRPVQQGQGKPGGPGGPTPVAIQVNFVSPSPRQQALSTIPSLESLYDPIN